MSAIPEYHFIQAKIILSKLFLFYNLRRNSYGENRSVNLSLERNRLSSMVQAPGLNPDLDFPETALPPS